MKEILQRQFLPNFVHEESMMNTIISTPSRPMITQEQFIRRQFVRLFADAGSLN